MVGPRRLYTAVRMRAAPPKAPTTIARGSAGVRKSSDIRPPSSGQRLRQRCLTVVHLRAVSRESVRTLVVARSATATKYDGFLNNRARQVPRLVLPQAWRKVGCVHPANEARDRHQHE